MNTFNQNNQYGNNIMNFGSQPRELNSSIETQLKQMIPSGSKVTVTSVLGDGEAYNFASQITNFLSSNGYTVDGVNQAVYSQQVKGQIIENPQGDKDFYNIIIGNKE